MRKPAILWTLFALVTVLTPGVYKTAYAMPGYMGALTCLAAIAVVLAILVLKTAKVTPLSIIAVVAGLAIGQWGFITAMIVLFFMQTGNFAP